MVLRLRLHVLEKYNFKKVSFEENIHNSWTHLNNSEIKEESRTKKRYVHIVVNIRKAVILFVRQRNNQLFVHFLLKRSNIFV